MTRKKRPAGAKSAAARRGAAGKSSLDPTLRRTTALLRAGPLETRAAAAIVLGALRPKAPSVERALRNAYEDAPAVLKPYVLDALAKLRSKATLELLAGLLTGTGASRDQAVALIADYGPEAFPAILAAAEAAPAADRTSLLLSAVRSGHPGSAAFATPAMTRGDGVTARRLARELRARRRTFSAATRRAWAGSFVDALADATRRRAGGEAAIATKLLRAFPTPKAAKPLIALLSDAPPRLLRSAVAALQATAVARSDLAPAIEALRRLADDASRPEGLRAAAARAARTLARSKADRATRAD
jgi:hypothetical protein